MRTLSYASLDVYIITLIGKSKKETIQAAAHLIVYIHDTEFGSFMDLLDAAQDNVVK